MQLVTSNPGKSASRPRVRVSLTIKEEAFGVLERGAEGTYRSKANLAGMLFEAVIEAFETFVEKGGMGELGFIEAIRLLGRQELSDDFVRVSRKGVDLLIEEINQLHARACRLQAIQDAELRKKAIQGTQKLLRFR